MCCIACRGRGGGGGYLLYVSGSSFKIYPVYMAKMTILSFFVASALLICNSAM